MMPIPTHEEVTLLPPTYVHRQVPSTCLAQHGRDNHSTSSEEPNETRTSVWVDRTASHTGTSPDHSRHHRDDNCPPTERHGWPEGPCRGEPLGFHGSTVGRPCLRRGCRCRPRCQPPRDRNEGRRGIPRGLHRKGHPPRERRRPRSPAPRFDMRQTGARGPVAHEPRRVGLGLPNVRCKSVNREALDCSSIRPYRSPIPDVHNILLVFDPPAHP